MSVVEVKHVRHHPEEPRRVGHRGLEVMSCTPACGLPPNSRVRSDRISTGRASRLDRHTKGIEDTPPVLAEHALRDGLVWIACHERGQFLGRQAVVLAHRFCSEKASRFSGEEESEPHSR